MIIPDDSTRVTSLPSFLANNSVGLINSAFLPLNQPNTYDNRELEIGLNIFKYLVWVPGWVGIWTVPYPHI